MDRIKVISLLTEISVIPIENRPINPDGSLDLKKFNELPKVKEVKNKLKAMKITRKVLDKEGFLAASMLLDL